MRVSKALSANDVGDTGGHQAGILVPKADEILRFFPPLPRTIKNPRVALPVRERISGRLWEFQYIYYNNKLFGGTRNEYRLTRMTKYLRATAARSGDILVFTKHLDGSIDVELSRYDEPHVSERNSSAIVLGSGWIYIPL